MRFSWNQFFQNGRHKISSSNRPIELKLGLNILYISLFSMNYKKHQISNFYIFLKLQIRVYFLSSRNFSRKKIFSVFMVHTIDIYTNLKPIFVFDTGHQKGGKRDGEDTFHSFPPLLQRRITHSNLIILFFFMYS